MGHESSTDPERVIVELMLEAERYQSFEAFDKLKRFHGGHVHIRAGRAIKRQSFHIKNFELVN